VAWSELLLLLLLLLDQRAGARLAAAA